MENKNYQGRSFKGQDLTNEDFSHADIRGADFTNANLTGANFRHAKAGLENKWVIRLVILCLLLGAIAGALAGLDVNIPMRGLIGKNPEERTIVPLILIVLSHGMFLFTTIRFGFQKGLALVGVGVASIVGLTGLLAGFATDKISWLAPFKPFLQQFRTGRFLAAFEQDKTGTEPAAIILSLALSIAILIGVVAMLSIAVTVVEIITNVQRGNKVLKFEYLLIVGAVIVAALIGGITTFNRTDDFKRVPVGIGIALIILATIIAVTLIVVSGYIALQVVAEDEKYAILRQLAVGLAATGGTNFKGANLTDAHFGNATLNSTDLRTANLTRTRWHHTKKLNSARVEDTILSDVAVRELLVSGDGYEKSYAGANLKGANLMLADLTAANLQEADLTDATLQNAHLEGANLKQIQAVGADFTEARMTGAYLEAWNIDSTTNLQWVDCRYVYLLLNPKPETDDRERRPSSGEFAPGEFTKLFEEVLDTVDLIFNKGIDWKAFLYTFQKIQVENQDTELAVQSIENKGDGVVVVKLAASEDADKPKIHQDFTNTYEEAVKALEAQYQAELQGKEREITAHRQRNANMIEVVRLLASRPIVTESDRTYSRVPKKHPGKLVILKLGRGDFNNGFPVTLQISSEGAIPAIEKQGSFPPSPELAQHYQNWQLSYHNLEESFRNDFRISIRQNQKTSSSDLIKDYVAECQQNADRLSQTFNHWLNSEEFRPLKDVLQQKLNPEEETLRLHIQTKNMQLHRLPWQLWDFFESYRYAELALSPPEYDRSAKPAPEILRTQVRILAILGNSQGINIQQDRAFLEKLPDADPIFLPEPTRLELDVNLRDEAGWDILFFAGHSHSQDNRGKIFINQTDSLTIDQLKYALRTAVDRGLKLAIFNSCDGLGLARDLADLQIPQIIVMREPIPDAIAAQFLQHFLKAFAGGKSLSASVREARERLHPLEDRYPCASWLPALCQHPAEIALTWDELRGIVGAEVSSQQGLKLLAQLGEMIENDLSLTPVDKADAIAAVQVLVQRVKYPQEKIPLAQVRTALKILKATPLGQEGEELLDGIIKTIGFMG